MDQKTRIIGKIATTPEQLKRINQFHPEYIASEDPSSRSDYDEIFKRVGDATIVLNNVSTPLPKEILEKCPRIKFIQTWSTGTDHIDLAYAKRNDIRVANVSGYSTEAVAEKTIGALLITANNLIEANKDAQKGKWNYQKFIGVELKNKTLLIIGDGRIARRISELASVFGMKSINTNSKTSKADLSLYIKKSNFITINCPLNNDTFHLFGREQFNLMNGIVLINYARGGIVDEDTMLEALNSGKLSFVAMDVFEKEPPDKNNPLLSHPRVFVTPHCAWNTKESIVNLTDKCIENIELFLSNKLNDFVV
jgi:phosphoglycerate dehydrogenase-like enzyme